jgi:hypothetical protein
MKIYPPPPLTLPHQRPLRARQLNTSSNLEVIHILKNKPTDADQVHYPARKSSWQKVRHNYLCYFRISNTVVQNILTVKFICSFSTLYHLMLPL